MLGAVCNPCCTPRAGCVDITLSGFSSTAPDHPPDTVGSPWVEWMDRRYDLNQTASIFATDAVLDGYDAWNGSASGYGKTQMVFDTRFFQYGPEHTSHAFVDAPVGGVAFRVVVAKYKEYAGAGLPDIESSEITFGLGGVLYYKAFGTADGSNPFKHTLAFTAADVISNASAVIVPGDVTFSLDSSSNAESSSVFSSASEVHVSIAPYSQHITLVRSSTSPTVFTYTSPDFVSPWINGTNISLTVRTVACGVRERLYLSMTGQIQLESSPASPNRFQCDTISQAQSRYRFMPDLFYGPYLQSKPDEWPTLPITYFSGPTYIHAIGQAPNFGIHQVGPLVTITIDGVS